MKPSYNHPSLWKKTFPLPTSTTHKYTRGHTIVHGGDATHSGAARLSAHAALRIGSGAVTLTFPTDALTIYASHCTAVMLKPCSNLEEWKNFLQQRSPSALIIGPGNGVSSALREMIKHALSLNLPTVLDADALTAYKEHPDDLFSKLHPHTILTPHAGEFAALFPDLKTVSDRITQAQTAAKRANAIIVLKGNHTLIAHPNGDIIYNQNAPATLATAGSGDVLAGYIGGLLAQSMPAFYAAAAGVWLHSACAKHFGLGLTAEDITSQLPTIFKTLKFKI